MLRGHGQLGFAKTGLEIAPVGGYFQVQCGVGAGQVWVLGGEINCLEPALKRLEAAHLRSPSGDRRKGRPGLLDLLHLQQQLDVIKAGSLVLRGQQNRLVQGFELHLRIVGIGGIADFLAGDLGLQHIVGRQVLV